MKQIPNEIVKELEARVPGFMKSVHHGEADFVTLTLDAFAGEPELLYNCMWFASVRGKAVMLAPSSPATETSA